MSFFRRRTEPAPDTPTITYGPSTGDDTNRPLWEIFSEIGLGYVLAGSVPAAELIDSLLSGLDARQFEPVMEVIEGETVAPPGMYTFVMGTTFRAEVLLFGMESIAGDESMAVFFAPGDHRAMGNLALSLERAVSVRQLCERVSGQWYMVCNGALCPDVVKLASANPEKGLNVATHDVGRRLATYRPAILV